jgi:hypothetical protein
MKEPIVLLQILKEVVSLTPENITRFETHFKQPHLLENAGFPHIIQRKVTGFPHIIQRKVTIS